MSKPRYILKQRTHLVSRQCFLGREYLPTSRKARKVFGYIMHEAAKRYGVTLHAATFLTNRYKIVLTDEQGLLPKFMERMNRHLALAVKRLQGIEGPVWDPCRSYDDEPVTCEAQLVDALALLRTMKADGDCRGGAMRWTLGSSSRAVKRPDDVFSEVMSPRVASAFGPPRWLTLLGGEPLRAQVRARSRVRRRERRRVHEDGRGRSVPGVGSSREMLVADMEPARRERGLRQLFLRAYRKAWRAVQAGLKRVFPRGTWWLAHYKLVNTNSHGANSPRLIA